MKKSLKFIAPLAIAASTLVGCGGSATTTTKVNVIFSPDYEGATVSTVEVDKDSVVAEQKAPTRAGYTFNGWRVAPEDTSAKYDFTQKVTGELKLYGSWTADDPTVGETCKVTFKSGVEGQADHVAKVDKGVSIPASAVPTLKRDRYDLVGWVDKEGNPFDINTPINQDIELTAKWEFNGIVSISEMYQALDNVFGYNQNRNFSAKIKSTADGLSLVTEEQYYGNLFKSLTLQTERIGQGYEGYIYGNHILYATNYRVLDKTPLKEGWSNTVTQSTLDKDKGSLLLGTYYEQFIYYVDYVVKGATFDSLNKRYNYATDGKDECVNVKYDLDDTGKVVLKTLDYYNNEKSISFEVEIKDINNSKFELTASTDATKYKAAKELLADKAIVINDKTMESGKNSISYANYVDSTEEGKTVAPHDLYTHIDFGNRDLVEYRTDEEGNPLVVMKEILITRTDKDGKAADYDQDTPEDTIALINNKAYKFDYKPTNNMIHINSEFLGSVGITSISSLDISNTISESTIEENSKKYNYKVEIVDPSIISVTIDGDGKDLVNDFSFKSNMKYVYSGVLSVKEGTYDAKIKTISIKKNDEELEQGTGYTIEKIDSNPSAMKITLKDIPSVTDVFTMNVTKVE